MEKFVIQGGAPLSRRDRGRRQQERRAADPRRLPAHRRGGRAHQRAADPRHRDPGRAARGPRREGRAGATTTSSRCAPTRSPNRARRGARRARSAPRSCSPARCSRASARRRCRRPAATSSAAGGSTRTSTPSSDLGARVDGDRAIEIGAPEGGLRAVRDLHGRAVRDGDRERADGGRADPGPDDDRATPPPSRTSRTSRGCWSRWAPQIDGIGSNVMTVHGRDKLGGAEHRICADHIEVASFMALAAATGGELRIRDAEPRRPDHDPPPVSPPRPAVDGRGRRRARAAGAGARGARRPRRRDPEDRRRPVARVPGRPHLDRAGARDPGAGHDPDLREDVREPPVLRRQARRDGRSDHALRSPQGDRQRSEPASR